MKKIILFAFSFVVMFLQMNAQTNNISLNINHKLGNADFTMNQAAKNNIDSDFNVTRLEYYISEISLIHDGGNETKIPELWILANASNKTIVELGEYNINSVEKIKLHIGVDAAHNHKDPASFQGSHPLAPKSPSMHWGWSAGYRFVAMEGNGGSNLNQLFELHGLGDVNYFTTEIDLDATAENNQLAIDLDADYTRALEGIVISSGLIVHGERWEAKQCLENFRDFVFSPSSITSSNIDYSEVNTFRTFPNPVTNGMTTIELGVDNNTFKYDLSITSMDGKQLQYVKSITNGLQVNVSNYASGMYLMNLIKEGQTIISNKIFIKQ